MPCLRMPSQPGVSTARKHADGGGHRGHPEGIVEGGRRGVMKGRGREVLDVGLDRGRKCHVAGGTRGGDRRLAGRVLACVRACGS